MLKIDRTTFLGCTYTVGLILVGAAILAGRYAHPDVIITLIVEIILLYISLFRDPLKRNELLAMVILTSAYYPLSVLLGIFSDMVVIAIGGAAIYVTMTVRIDLNPTKGLLAGIFSAGIFFAFYLMVQRGTVSPDVLMAIIIHMLLLYMALSKKPPDKSELAAISLLILICLSLSLLLRFFSFVVIWTLGSLAFYGFVRVEPKFPLTKRAIVTGLIVGVVMTFMGIYLALKIGIVFLVGAEMLGALFLGVKGRYTREENAVAVTISNTSSMVAIGVLLTYPAIAIFDPANPLFNVNNVDYSPIMTLLFIMFTTGISAIFGIVILAPFRHRFENEPWPRVQPQVECINSIGSDAKSKRAVGIGLAGSGAWVGATKISETATGMTLTTFPNALAPMIPAVTSIPDWIGISNSPMIAGIGFFVGWKRSLVMLLGGIISILIWIILEGADGAVLYTTHLKRPEILYLALGVFVTVILADVVGSKDEGNLSPEEIQEKMQPHDDDVLMIETPHKSNELSRSLRVKEELFSIEAFKEDVRQIIKNPRDFMRSKRGQVPVWIALVSMGLFIIVGLIVFWFIKPFMASATSPLEIHWLLIIFGTPLALVSAYFTARAISETGMLAGYISDMISIPAILLFRTTFSAVTTFMGMLGAIQDAAIALLVHLKLGSMTGVRGRDILKAVFIGTMLGSTVGSFITFEVFSTYGFGTVDFPSPAAQLFGFLVLSLQGLGHFQLPGVSELGNLNPIVAFLYLLAWAIGGFLMGRTLSKHGLSPISLVVGVLIPPATSVTILIGGLINYKAKHPHQPSPMTDHLPQQVEVVDVDYSNTSRILSGVVAGEAVVTVIWVLLNAFSFL